MPIADAPKPNADFNYQVFGNGSVHFHNLSTNANSIKWDFGDGSSSTLSDVAKTYYKNGNYTVTLTAKNDNGESVATKTVAVTSVFTPTTGEIMFWTRLNKKIKIYVNGFYKGMTTVYQTASSTPICNTQGFLTLTFPQGSYSYTAETDELFPLKWSGVINVTNGQCNKFELMR